MSDTTFSKMTTGGLLKYNQEIRNRMLQRNLGKYAMIDNNLAHPIGEAYEIGEITYPKDLKNGKDLLSFTFDEDSIYGKERRRGVEDADGRIEVYSVTPSDPYMSLKWGGRYDNYVKYVSDVYGYVPPFVTIANQILATRNIGNALQLHSPAIVKNFNVVAAMNGVNMTNINNLSGTDTPLGNLTNMIFSTSLYNAANINTARGRGDKSSKFPYITPKLAEKLGNNVSNLNKLTDIGRVWSDTGRMTDLFTPYDELGVISSPEELHGGRPYIDLLSEEGDNSQISKFLLPFVKGELLPHGVEDSNKYTFYNPYYGIRSGKSYIGGTSREYENSVDMRKAIYEEKDLNYQGSEFTIIAPDLSSESVLDAREYSSNPLSASERKTTLLQKVGDQFRNGTIKAFVSRTYDNRGANKHNAELGDYDTSMAKSNGSYLRSRGRNLLNCPSERRGENTFCRAWSKVKQYRTYLDTVQPIGGMTHDDIQGSSVMAPYRAKIKGLSSDNDGGHYLAANSVMDNETGLVRFAPTSKRMAKYCMFSIENLAWKDISRVGNNLSEEQTGPNGGRIMWIPPYGLEFSESVNTDWVEHRFVGRGEPVMTYANTSRNITLNFTLLVDHPSIIHAKHNVADGESNDEEQNGVEHEILRFFAGCCPLGAEKGKDGTEEQTDIVVVSNEPSETTNLTKSATEVIYVFFPNNYSGNWNDGKKIKDAELNSKGSLDRWMHYVAVGQGITTPYDRNQPWEPGNGYEVMGAGLSEGYDGETIKADKGGSDDRYSYLVDSDLQQVLKNKANYKDNESFGLNRNLESVKSMTGFEDATATFWELYLIWWRKTGQGESYNKVYQRLPDDAKERLDRLKDLAGLQTEWSKPHPHIDKVEIYGSATKQNEINSGKLARRRGLAAKALFENWGISDILKDTSVEVIDADKLKDASTTNSREAKAQRYAKIVIRYTAPVIKDSADALSPERRYDDASGNTSGMTNGVTSGVTGNTSSSTTSNPSSGATRNMTNGVSMLDNRTDKEKEMERKMLEDGLLVLQKSDTTNEDGNRYETESEYFDRIKRDDPLIYNSITQKFKYFNPAYHSLSPEGFNARLTFLQQCMRQGHTTSVADKGYETTAGNLAFGRMPVCVVRIGDFIYSKIIFKTMTIDYKTPTGTQWDTNMDGIGVQPMYATVSMTGEIVGGQSLNGPINRLQNGNSFNHYANTGVYDNRSDRIHMTDSGELAYDYMWTPSTKNTVKETNTED